MTISERIFEKLQDMEMTQKRFSELTGIRQSTISEWKKKKTNPTAEKILDICRVLDVSPEWLLSGADSLNHEKSRPDWFIISKDSEAGQILVEFNEMNLKQRARLLGYIEAMKETE